MSLGLGMGLWLGNNVAATSGGGGGATAIWNSASGTNVADWDLTGAGLTATRNRTTSFNGSIRTTTAKTSGTVIVTVNAAGTGTIPVIIGLDDGTEASYPGADNNGHSIGYRGDTGAIIFCGGTIATVATYTTGDVIKIVRSGTNVSFFKNNVQQGATIDMSSLGYINPAAPLASAASYVLAFNGNGTGTSLTLDVSGW